MTLKRDWAADSTNAAQCTSNFCGIREVLSNSSNTKTQSRLSIKLGHYRFRGSGSVWYQLAIRQDRF
jgi:hypothetical protein